MLRLLAPALLALLTLPALAVTPQAAFAALIIDAPASYTPGDIVTVEISGDSEGAIADAYWVNLEIDPNVSVLSGTRNITKPSSTFVGVLDGEERFLTWESSSIIGRCGIVGLAPNECVAGSGYELFLRPRELDMTLSILSTFQIDTTGASGPLTWILTPDPTRGFFGLPGVSATTVPEPATAALCALGMILLAAARPRSS